MASDVLIRINDSVDGEALESLTDRAVELSEDVGRVLRGAIGRIAKELRPDLSEIGASKATVKVGVKVVAKAGGLAALITEVGGEATVEVSVEFTAP